MKYTRRNPIFWPGLALIGWLLVITTLAKTDNYYFRTTGKDLFSTRFRSLDTLPSFINMRNQYEILPRFLYFFPLWIEFSLTPTGGMINALLLLTMYVCYAQYEMHNHKQQLFFTDLAAANKLATLYQQHKRNLKLLDYPTYQTYHQLYPALQNHKALTFEELRKSLQTDCDGLTTLTNEIAAFAESYRFNVNRLVAFDSIKNNKLKNYLKGQVTFWNESSRDKNRDHLVLDTGEELDAMSSKPKME